MSKLEKLEYCSICQKTLEDRKAEGYELDYGNKLDKVGMAWCSYLCPVCRDVMYDVISDYLTDDFIDDLIIERLNFLSDLVTNLIGLDVMNEFVEESEEKKK